MNTGKTLFAQLMGRSKPWTTCHDGIVDQGMAGTIRTARSPVRFPCLETEQYRSIPMAVSPS